MLSQVLIKNDKGSYVQFSSSTPKNEFDKSYELIRPLPRKKGRGHFSSFSICEGLAVGLCHCRFDEDYIAQSTLKNPLISLGFCIKGYSLFRNVCCHPDPVVAAPGRSYAYFFEESVVEREIKGQQDVLTLGILVSPDFLIQLFNPTLHQDTQYRDTQYRDTLEKMLESRHFYADHIMTTQMETTVYQILNNPHKGEIGKIYLESKAVELIALKLEQIFQPDYSSNRNAPMVPEDRELIFQVRDLLVKNLQYPSSLRKLAKQVEMSTPRLTKGFRTVFGCTVFEYLRKERLSYARMLIEENPVDLTWIAFESGFCSSSHFAASFFKEYGIRPSEYRKSIYMTNRETNKTRHY